jgi:FkbM family methyltransferase
MEKTTRLVEYWQEDGNLQVGQSTATIFYSQCGEDLQIYIDFFYPYEDKFKGCGTYIELGASDGVKFSNTKFFEDELGFKGILIEPVPWFCDVLKKTRPNNHIFNYAISEDEKELDLLVSLGPGGGWVSGLDKYMSPEHKQAWHSETEIIKVQCKKIKNLIELTDLDTIDIFSIDVEGAEYEVLKTFDWKVPVYVFCIEMSDADVDKNQNCRDLLEENKFVFHKKIGMSEIWYNPKYIEEHK